MPEGDDLTVKRVLYLYERFLSIPYPLNGY